jgi:hypothetical protein
VPISVQLIKESDFTYTGIFIITTSTPSGTAYAVFSGRDMVGNRGTEIKTGLSLNIDTAGPAVARLVTIPVEPIKNDETHPVSVIVTLGLNEKVKTGTKPTLSCQLSAQGRQPVAITNIIQLDTQQGDAQTWQAMFTLSDDAGLAEAESLQFIFQATDDLDNTGNKISCTNVFQVYQGNLPPLAAPGGLIATALPHGEISLKWNAVTQSVGYMLYRKAPGEADLTGYQRIDTGLEIIDAPSVEGLYSYAIASIRSENNQESAVA